MKDPSVAQSIVFVVDDDAAIRESIDPSVELNAKTTDSKRLLRQARTDASSSMTNTMDSRGCFFITLLTRRQPPI
jgi:FixJ family two-component response regulator